MNITPGTIAYQVLEFFAENPDEELTAEMVAIKWDRALNNVRDQLKKMADQNLVARRLEVSGKARTVVYSALVMEEAA